MINRPLAGPYSRGVQGDDMVAVPHLSCESEIAAADDYKTSIIGR
jgi:hypothetical protein